MKTFSDDLNHKSTNAMEMVSIIFLNIVPDEA